MPRQFDKLRPRVREALEILGIRNFLLGIHDAAFPCLPEEDIGRGSPYSRGAAQFLHFIRDLGFDGIQLGPQGITTVANPSPYDGTVFSRNLLSLAPLPLTQEPWRMLHPEELAHLASAPSFPIDRVEEDFARKAVKQIAAKVCRWYRQERGREKSALHAPLHHSFARFRRHDADWLERDALYEILRHNYGGKNWKEWGEDPQARLDKCLFAPPTGLENSARARITGLRSLHQPEMEDYCFTQYLLHDQHMKFRQQCRLLGLKLFCDCQIGLSGRDTWYAQSFLLPGYLMGAPPSRTNPEGQPWNYPVLDPRQYYQLDRDGCRQSGPVVRFFRRRIDKLFEEFDGLRIDHPHGLICPWVYQAGQPDALRAVQTGARLFASPALADHPELARFAIPRPDQINLQAKRHADDWVTSLEPEQVRRYAELLEVIMQSARDKCCGACEIACEILSTQPYPVKKVMELYGLGRFRVTQKADLNNIFDVYRSENARPEDWLMLGNHDTPSIWQVTEKWLKTGVARQQAAYLATRLGIAEEKRQVWIEDVAADAGALAQAKFADLFIGPARNIMVFFTDLLGIKQSYNIPGTLSRENWSLRIRKDYHSRYLAESGDNKVLNIPGALAMALRARGSSFRHEHRSLISELESPG